MGWFEKVWVGMRWHGLLSDDIGWYGMVLDGLGMVEGSYEMVCDCWEMVWGWNQIV